VPDAPEGNPNHNTNPWLENEDYKACRGVQHQIQAIAKQWKGIKKA